LADALARPEGTVRQWARGAVRIPEDVAAWLARAVAGEVPSLQDEIDARRARIEAWYQANPPPARAPADA
ncbi:MAG: hypothetical protein ACOYOH_26850, partial [Paracraurococcus sp.]